MEMLRRGIFLPVKAIRSLVLVRGGTSIDFVAFHLQSRRFASQRTKSELLASGTPQEGFSPFRNQQEITQWEKSSNGSVSRASGKGFEDETQALTDLCQKQVNYWHAQEPLTDEQVSAVKKIAKLTILNRNKNITGFINVLEKENVFKPNLMYLTAQTMFRGLPALAQKYTPTTEAETIKTNGHIRLRLFNAAVVQGHIPSALWLILAVPSNTPEGKLHEEVALRCLDDTRTATYGKDIHALARAVKADVAGDIPTARAHFTGADKMGLGEFEYVWKRCVEYLFAADEDKALATILAGMAWIGPYLIMETFQQFLEYTKNPRMKVIVLTYLNDFQPESYPLTSIAAIYESLGNAMVAREYYEIAGATGDKEAQQWMISYLDQMAKGSWFNGKTYAKQRESWKRLSELGPDERLSGIDNK